MTPKDSLARPVNLTALLLWLLLPGLGSAGLCPKGCRCDDPSLSAVCAGANLKVVPIFLNPGIKTLDARDNKIHRLEGSLNFYSSLELLDLSHNEFKHVGAHQFANQEQLQLLNLSNNFLTTLHANSFRGPRAMQILDLSHNALASLSNRTFAGLDSLVELRLRHNQLEAISTRAFEGLSRLRVLHLEHNRLESLLPPNWLVPMGNLRFLYASHNEIVYLQEDTFRQLKALREVTLSNNRLTTANISENAFRGCRLLDTLDLSYNELVQVPNGALVHLPQLSHLDLSGNKMVTLDRGSFHSFFILEVLNLSNLSRLEAINGHTFIDCAKLNELYLENNPHLSPLPWDVFSANTQLETLSIRNNSWASLSPYQVPQQSLQTLYIGGLPLHCNCSVIWLWELFQRGENSSVELDPVHCSSISSSNSGPQKGGEPGDPLSMMSVNQLACENWAQALLVISLSILITLLLLILFAVIIYKCRQCRGDRSCGTPCLHIKDDTMVYKGTLHAYRSSTSAGGGVAGEATYKAVSSAGGYSPPDEPFYEVPKYMMVMSNQQVPPSIGIDEGSFAESQNPGASDVAPAPTDHEPKSSSSLQSSSKYSTTSGYIGSELWEPEYFQSPAHCYTNSGRIPPNASLAAQRHGSPQSLSTGLGSSSTSTGSSTSSGHNGRPPPPPFNPSSSSCSSSPSRYQHHQQQAAATLAFPHHSNAVTVHSPTSMKFSTAFLQPQDGLHGPYGGGGGGGVGGQRAILPGKPNSPPSKTLLLPNSRGRGGGGRRGSKGGSGGGAVSPNLYV